MQRYIVEYIDTVTYAYEVLADSEEEAESLTQAQYDNASPADADSVSHLETNVYPLESQSQLSA